MWCLYIDLDVALTLPNMGYLEELQIFGGSDSAPPIRNHVPHVLCRGNFQGLSNLII